MLECIFNTYFVLLSPTRVKDGRIAESSSNSAILPRLLNQEAPWMIPG
jgi:hypothetical protein